MEVERFSPSCPTCRLISLVYRFVFTAVRGSSHSGVQLSRVVLYDRDGRVIPVRRASSPGDVVVRSVHGVKRLVAEPAADAGSSGGPAAQKWHGGALPAVVDLQLEVPTHVAAYEIFTATDAPVRDPTAWNFGALQPDGRFVVLRSVARASAPWARNASYGYELLGSLTRPGAVVPGVPGAGATVGPVGNCSELLLLLLRGDTFRQGASGARGESEIAPQREVLAAIAANVVAPAVRLGWWVFPLADVSAPAARSATFRALATEHLQMDARALRIHPRNETQPTQALSILEALRWSARIAGSLLRQAAWRALLVLRADVLLKLKLPLPEPSFPTQSILVPFQVSDMPFNKRSGEPRVADNLLYVPQCRFANLVHALTAHSGRDNLHDMCGWLHGPVGYWLSTRHDANSAHERNPLFRMAGRPEANTSCKWPPCHPTNPLQWRARGMPCGWPPASDPGEPAPCTGARCAHSTWERDEKAKGLSVSRSAFLHALARLSRAGG
eukprot:1581555-Prymnesium_polylepis.1